MFHEFDMEKSLVTAEMTTESKKLLELEAKLTDLRRQMKKMELQRMSNQTSQEVQQIKLKNSMAVKQNEIDSIERQIWEWKKENKDVSELEDKLNSTTDALENEQKSFEDLEFHFLEEEAEW
jgi:predicted  nucleic acid-binding Zn-ribbon protein